MAMKKYRVMVPTVDAVQWDGSNEQELVDMVPGGVGEVVGTQLTITTGGDQVVARLSVGEWLLRRNPGEPVWTKTSREFDKNYEPV